MEAGANVESVVAAVAVAYKNEPLQELKRLTGITRL